MARTLSTFDKNAIAVKNTVLACKGSYPETSDKEKNLLSASDIRTYMLEGMREMVKQAESLRAGGANMPCLDISLAQMAYEKYGISYNEVTGSPDGFLQMLGINPSQASIQSLMTMPDVNIGYTWLVPEIVREAIRLGIRRDPIYGNFIAGEENVSGLQIIVPAIEMSDATATELGEAETIPTGEMRFNQKTVKLMKVGTGISLTDEVIQYCSLNLLTTYLQDVGVKLGTSLDAMAIQTLINGDATDGSDSVATIGANTVNTLAYRDILRIWIRMSVLGRRPQNILGNEDSSMDLLDLQEFKGFAGTKTMANIRLTTPVPTEQGAYISGYMPTGNKLLFVDNTSAMIKFNASALNVKSEEIISKGVSNTYASLTTGFATMYKDARVMLDYSLDYATNGFPAYMAYDNSGEFKKH